MTEFILTLNGEDHANKEDEDDEDIGAIFLRQSGVSTSGNNISSGRNSCGAVIGMDADVCNWSLEADLHSSFLRCSLAFLDINKIPRNHLR